MSTKIAKQQPQQQGAFKSGDNKDSQDFVTAMIQEISTIISNTNDVEVLAKFKKQINKLSEQAGMQSLDVRSQTNNWEQLKDFK